MMLHTCHDAAEKRTTFRQMWTKRWMST